MSLAIATPSVTSRNSGLTQSRSGKLAFWKMILPKKQIQYTAKDGSRQTATFDEKYLTDLAANQAVDKLAFLLADKDNAHTMDPERVRGEVAELQVREDGLYGKIVFPNAAAAQAILDNPDLGVSARIREGVQRSDGSTIDRGLIHVLGTLDPQVSGMPPWEATDLSTEADAVLDLSNEEFQDMEDIKTEDAPKALDEYTDADIDKMTDVELDAFLAEFAAPVADYNEDEDDLDLEDADEDVDTTKEPVGAGADMSNKDRGDIDLANQRADAATKRANEALARVADAEWKSERSSLLAAGVPPHALDLAAPVLARADEMVIDLSVSDEADVNVSEVVRGLLETLKGSVDLSNESGHGGHFDLANGGEDPDKANLDRWDAQS